MSGQAETRYPHAHRTAARVGGALLLTGGLLAVVLMFVGPGFVHGKTEITLVIASCAIIAGGFCVSVPGRVPAWGLTLIGPFGTVLIALSSILTRTTTDGSELLYMWTVLFSAYFLAWRFALINIALIAVVYPSIAISLMGRLGITPSVYLVGTSVVTLLIVGNLRRQISRVITQTALEARTDKLTDLPNRRSWEEGLAREVARQGRRRTPLCILVIDLDHFKALNDTYGHAAGDVALAGVAGVLRGQARQSDVLARVGGEEFALLLPDCAPIDARMRAQEIRLAIERASANWQTPVTVSIGVAALPAHARNAEELMEAGDVALYEAKRAGRNTVRMYKVDGPPPIAVETRPRA
jgi:diguanylate cyclase (GGDEF)-like protein